MKRILFVDDEPRILDGLRRMLRGMREQWDMSFANSGQEAIAKVAEAAFDVVVTDMRMPGVDGAALLAHLQQHQPDIVRIVLSGHTELEAAMRAIPIAHSFLSKPCEATALREAVERSCSLQSVLTSPSLRSMVNAVKALPVVPHVYQQISAALQRNDVTMAEVAGLVMQDPAICAKTLQIVNSGFFGLQRKVSRMEEAVTLLGLTALRDLVLFAGVFRQLEERPANGLDMEQFQKHAVMTARIARGMAANRQQGQEAFTAGMLHDLGRIVVGEDGEEGMGHAEAGGYLLGLWGVPFPIVEAVTHHHAPGRVPAGTLGLIGLVHVAEVLAHEVAGDPHGHELPALALDYLQQLGVADCLPVWRARAQELAAQE